MGARRMAAGLVLAASALAACGALDSDTVTDIHDATGVDVTDPAAAVTAAASGGTTGNAAEDPVLDATRALRRVTYEKRGDDAMEKDREIGGGAYAAAAGEYEKALGWVTPGDRAKERQLQLKYADANYRLAATLGAVEPAGTPISVAERNAYLTSAQAYGRAAQLSSDDADKASALEKKTVAYWNAGDAGRSCDSIKDYLALRPGDPKAEAFRQRNCR